MEFKISKYIAELLTHYGQVKVKGLGTFVANNPASTPTEPGERFQLNPQLDADILLKHIMATTEMDLQVATTLISEEVEQIRKIADSGELVYLKKIGHLYRNHLGRFVFLPEKSDLNQAQFLHPELDLEPITEAEIAAVKALIKKPSKTKFQLSKKLSTIAPIAVLLLACVLTWSLISNRSDKNKRVSYTKIPVSEKRVNKKPVYTPPPVLEKKQEVEKPVVAPEVDTEAATINPNAKECVIIVGQFRSKDGARRRVSDIYDFGYAAYQDHANGLSRVGIQFAYETEADIQEMMRKVKKRFDVDSWILKQ